MLGVIAGVIGVGWMLLDAVGTEWDWCPRTGNNCVAGWKMGAAFTVVAVIAGVVGLGLLRRERHDSRSRKRLA